MIANEKAFDKQLTRIGELYEEGKEVLQEIQFNRNLMLKQGLYDRAFEIIRELRDIAATSLKEHHKITEN